MKKKYDYVIGIDPDIEKCGVATLTVEDGTVSLQSLSPQDTIFRVLDFAHDYMGYELAVVVELDRKNLFNWHVNPNDTKGTAKRKGFDQGRCYQTAVMIADIIKGCAINVVEKAPLIKMWSGPDRKITHDEVSRLRGLTIVSDRKTTNQEQRDAILLALDVAEFPIILDRKK